MQLSPRRAMLVFVMGLLVLGGCSERNEITGRKQLSLIPASTMRSMARTEYRGFLKKNPLSQNAAQTVMVKRVGGRIQKAVEMFFQERGKSDKLKNYAWEFNLIESKQVNAWAMPGGKVVVYTGLLPVTRDEAGLAVVMGHEIAHAIAHHGRERMSQALLITMGGIALNQAIKNKPTKTRVLFLGLYGAGSGVGYLLPNSRLQESEADQMGLIFMTIAGYDPGAAVGLWERMDKASSGKRPPQFLSTHPNPKTRIIAIKKSLPEIRAKYTPLPAPLAR